MTENRFGRRSWSGRHFAAMGYSLSGLKHIFATETSFRQELICWLLLLAWLFYLPLSVEFKMLLLGTNTLVLILELLNTAIERIVDLTSPEFNIKAKIAKDLGSAAVLVSLALAVTLWIIAIYKAYFSTG